jgi:hypothetical protein
LFGAVVKADFPRTKMSMSRWVNENSDEGVDSTMSAETIPFEIQVESVLEGGIEERKASSSGTEEMRVGVDAEVVMLS